MAGKHWTLYQDNGWKTGKPGAILARLVYNSMEGAEWICMLNGKK